MVVVGGLVPTLLCPLEKLAEGVEAHVGTQDLDLGLSLALLNGDRYTPLVDQLRNAGFKPDRTGNDGPANHRWKHQLDLVTVDFLIHPTEPGHAESTTRVIEESLSAVLTPTLPLAFLDRQKISLTGKTLRGEDVTRDIWVCGPGAFVVMKAHAIRGRGKLKDAYDLFYVLRSYGKRYVEEVATAMRPLLDHPTTRGALEIIKTDCTTITGIGPTRAAEFLGRSDDAYRSDLAGAATELLRLLVS
jgi:hypothetical protein